MKFHLIVGDKETSVYCTECSRAVGNKRNIPPEDFGVMPNEAAISLCNTLCYGYESQGGTIRPMTRTPKAFYWCGRFKQICEKANVPCEVKEI